MVVLHAATFWCAALIFLLRARHVWRNPQGRATWAATGVGALGLLTLGSVVPQRDLDALLGGTNVINLAQNLLAATAFWLMLRASTQDLPERPLLARPLSIVVMLAAFTVPFLFIQDRGGTVFTFLIDELHQTPAWLYGTIYMCVVGALAASTLVRGVLRSPGALVVFRVGLVLVLVASVDELLSMAADHFGLFDEPTRVVLRFLFDPPFYVGIVLIVAAMASLTMRRWSRDAEYVRHGRRLERIARRHGLRGRGRRGDPRVRAYDLVIAIRDAEVQGQTLSPAEAGQLRSAESVLARSLVG
ncbi:MULTISPECIES: hypothetical protein [unclassified Curtobacterium]|uniref:hypothetical protein n=1 Tax=unclassified Curtobacterium TaxID=257496 RepID=UPI00226B5C98|nr:MULTISPECIES: hypothetical protein [unclassified Curtobacterium]